MLFQFFLSFEFRGWECGPMELRVSTTPDQLSSAVINSGPPKTDCPNSATADLSFITINTILV